jgi:hypothetical protein
VRRKDREITEKTDLIKIIEASDVCRIAIHAEKAPYIVPLNFGFLWENSLEIFFHCAMEGRKLELLKRNNLVGFEMDTGHTLLKAENVCSWGMAYKSIIGTGRIFSIVADEEKEKAMDRIMMHYSFAGKPLYDTSVFAKTLVLKMMVEEMTGKEKA